MTEYRVFSLYIREKNYIYDTYLQCQKKILDFINTFDLPKPETLMNIITVANESEQYFKLKGLVNEAEKYGILIQEHTYKMQYKKDDMSKAHFFELKLNIYGKSDYTESYQTEYNDFYCRECDTHQYTPKGELYINKTEFRRKDIAVSNNLNNEIIISDKLKNLIETDGLTGASFYPAHHYNDRLKDDYPAWRLAVRSIMPPIDPSMPVNILEQYCPICKRHHILPLSYVRYKKSDTEGASDFNLSAESFGPGWYGSPKLIVSRKAYDLIRDNKIKGCRFEIVGERI